MNQSINRFPQRELVTKSITTPPEEVARHHNDAYLQYSEACFTCVFVFIATIDSSPAD